MITGRLPLDTIADRWSGQTPERQRLWRRAARDGLSIAGVISIALVASFYLAGDGTFGFDAHAYWRLDWTNLYAGTGSADGYDAYRYAPVFAQVLSPFWVLDFLPFLLLWTGVLVVALVWLGRDWALALCAFPLVIVEFGHSNVHILLAAAIVLGFRYPWTWVLPLVTKVTPGIGLVWFAVRREWAKLGFALGVTAIVVAVSALLGGVNLWQQWLSTLLTTQAATGANHIAVPLVIRLPIALVLVAWAARTDRAWVVPAAAMLALPTIWFHSLSMLVGSFALLVSRRDWAPKRTAI